MSGALTTPITGKLVRQRSWFDKRGRVFQQSDDDGTSTGTDAASGAAAAGARVKAFKYLPGGQLVSASPDGGASGVSYLYGSLGRLRARIDFGGTNALGSSWMRYDTAYSGSDTDGLYYYPLGRLSTAYTCPSISDCNTGGAAPLTRQAFGYDVDGNVVRKDAFWSGLTGSTSVKRAVRNDGRELWSQVSGASLSTPVSVATFYDSAGRPVQLRD